MSDLVVLEQPTRRYWERSELLIDRRQTIELLGIDTTAESGLLILHIEEVIVPYGLFFRPFSWSEPLAWFWDEGEIREVGVKRVNRYKVLGKPGLWRWYPSFYACDSYEHRHWREHFDRWYYKFMFENRNGGNSA